FHVTGVQTCALPISRGYEAKDASSSGARRPLPPPQPLLPGVRRMGFGGTWRASAVRGRRASGRRLLREDAWRHASFSGSVPPARSEERRGGKERTGW